jgi:cell division septum initiation protein DivIVA
MRDEDLPPAADLAGGDFPTTKDENSSAGAAAGEKVASIIEAAQSAADQLRQETEERVRARIAEADRGAENRVTAAEEEAHEILSAARAEAKKLRAEAKAEADRLVSEATSKGLEIAGRAQEEADRTLAEASGESEKLREDIATRARELMRHAEETASELNHEGYHMVGNLRELGDSLRVNADRLLKDVQTIHTRMVAQIERVQGEAGPARSPRRSRSSADREGDQAAGDALPPPPDDDELDVPEFVPPG